MSELVDVVCGGFPCQPVSLAGQARGAADERWLWPEFARVLGVLRPRFVVLENVPGLLTADGGRLFGGVLADLAALGFHVEWHCIPAAAFGAPHLRYRVIAVGYADRCGLTRLDREGAQSTFGCEAMANAPGARLEGPRQGRIRQSDWWATEPKLGRVAYGVPNRVDRLRALGNAVVPQLAEWIGQRIVAWSDQVTAEDAT